MNYLLSKSDLLEIEQLLMRLRRIETNRKIKTAADKFLGKIQAVIIQEDIFNNKTDT